MAHHQKEGWCQCLALDPEPTGGQGDPGDKSWRYLIDGYDA